MADTAGALEVKGESKSVLAGLTTKQKLIGAGAIVAVILGLYVARQNAQSGTTTRSYDQSTDEQLTPWLPGDWMSPGAGNPGTTNPTTPTNPVNPVNPTAPTVIVPSVPVLPDIPIIPAVPTISYSGRTGSSIAGAISTVTNPGIGNGGVDYTTLGKTDQQAMISDMQALRTDPAYLASEQYRTQQVIDNRVAAGLDVTDQLKYQSHLNAVADGTSVAPSSGSTSSNSGSTSKSTTSSSKSTAAPLPTSTAANPGIGNGGGNYNTVSAADKASMVNTGQQLAAGNTAFISSEQQRAAAVIANRQAQGLDTSAQEAYVAKLNTASAAAATNSTAKTSSATSASSKTATTSTKTTTTSTAAAKAATTTKK